MLQCDLDTTRRSKHEEEVEDRSRRRRSPRSGGRRRCPCSRPDDTEGGEPGNCERRRQAARRRPGQAERRARAGAEEPDRCRGEGRPADQGTGRRDEAPHHLGRVPALHRPRLRTRRRAASRLRRSLGPRPRCCCRLPRPHGGAARRGARRGQVTGADRQGQGQVGRRARRRPRHGGDEASRPGGDGRTADEGATRHDRRGPEAADDGNRERHTPAGRLRRSASAVTTATTSSPEVLATARRRAWRARRLSRCFAKPS